MSALPPQPKVTPPEASAVTMHDGAPLPLVPQSGRGKEPEKRRRNFQSPSANLKVDFPRHALSSRLLRTPCLRRLLPYLPSGARLTWPQGLVIGNASHYRWTLKTEQRRGESTPHDNAVEEGPQVLGCSLWGVPVLNSNSVYGRGPRPGINKE